MASPRYQKNAQGYTKWLRARDVEKRRKAARMVGELGVAEADVIQRLTILARNDPDEIVRQNATYSLGMFAAFRDAMESEDDDVRDEAEAAVMAVYESGQIGKPARYSDKQLRIMLFSLVGVLVVLVGVNLAVLFVTPMGGFGGGEPRQTQVAGGTGSSQIDTEAVSLQLATMRTNADTLRQQYDPVIAGGTPDLDLCAAFYNVTLTPLDASAVNPDAATFYETLNTRLAELESAYQRMQQACYDEMPFAADEAPGYYNPVTLFLNEYPDLEAQFNTLTVGEPTEAPPTPAGPTATPTPIPDIRLEAGRLRDIIDEAQGVPGSRAPGIILNQYWTDVLENGTTDGCNTQLPPIPGNYQIDAVPGLAEASPDMVLAVEQVNLGLQTLRDGYSTFQTACDGGDSALAAQAPGGAAVSGAARVYFDAARQILDQLQGF